MPLLIRAPLKALRSLLIPGMGMIAFWSVLLALGVLTLFVIAIGFAFDWWSGHLASTLLAPWLGWMGALGAFFVAWLLFPGIMPIFVNFFDNRIASLIERHEYAATPARENPFWPELWHDVRFSLLAIFLNIAILPLYLLPVLNLFIFYLLNGYLLGREFFIMVARRHMPIEQAVALRKTHGRMVTLSGMMLALLATLPFINLFAPFWGIALMTHLYHGVKGTPASTLISPRIGGNL